jgi:hypothetical protein
MHYHKAYTIGIDHSELEEEDMNILYIHEIQDYLNRLEN